MIPAFLLINTGLMIGVEFITGGLRTVDVITLEFSFGLEGLLTKLELL
jgi:hypothetical protein